jgi:hypothetical protein
MGISASDVATLRGLVLEGLRPGVALPIRSVVQWEVAANSRPTRPLLTGLPTLLPVAHSQKTRSTTARVRRVWRR